MSKKNNRRKRKRAFITVTALLILLFIAIKVTNGNLLDKNNSANIPSTPLPSTDIKEPVKEDKDDIITELSISPENYTAKTGEIINADTFKIKAVYKSGKSEDIDENITYSTDNSIFKFQDDSVIISDDALTADSGILTVNYDGMAKDISIKIFNGLSNNINENFIVTNISAYDMIVNKERNLSSNYVPEDLVPLDGIPTILKNPEVNQLRKVAYDALKKLFSKAKEEKSFELYARSGYRSYNTQKDLYNSYVANHGQEAADKFSAKPGQSEHQSGLAMDITSASMNYQLDDTFFDTEEGKWVAENAHKFGFVIRYPKGKEDITGYQYEPWHLRYVGLSLAKETYESQLTLEEYFK